MIFQEGSWGSSNESMFLARSIFKIFQSNKTLNKQKDDSQKLFYSKCGNLPIFFSATHIYVWNYAGGLWCGGAANYPRYSNFLQKKKQMKFNNYKQK